MGCVLFKQVRCSSIVHVFLNIRSRQVNPCVSLPNPFFNQCSTQAFVSQKDLPIIARPFANMFRPLVASQQLTFLGLLPIILLGLLVASAKAAGVDDRQCVDRALSSPFFEEIRYRPGLNVGFLPYPVCNELCPGWTHFPLNFIAFLIIQFILPTIIFVLVIPRRWHIDLPSGFFTLRLKHVLNILKHFFSPILMVIVAIVDLVVWACAIMALSGPMIFSALHELFLDNRVLQTLRAATSQGIHHSTLTIDERLDLLVALMCGNFSGNPWNITNKIRTAFLLNPGLLIDPSDLKISKKRLKCVATSQAPFSVAVGIAALFFVGGFLYTAIGMNELTALGDDATPYALWLMTMLFVAIVASTSLTGNTPSVVNVLTELSENSRISWCPLLVDYYQDELYPIAIWDRGLNKRKWILESQAFKNKKFAKGIQPSKWSWVGIYLTTTFLSLFPSIMAFQMAYNVPYPREGCRTLTYATYIACQIWLTAVAFKRSTTSLHFCDFPAAEASTTLPQTWQRSLRLFFYILASLATVIAVILAFLVSFLGTIFQIFGVYNNCLCQTPVSTWIRPAVQRRTFISFGTDEIYRDHLSSFTSGMTWAASVVTMVICSLSWCYQRSTFAAAQREINAL
jgi:hypothetical protein